MYKVKEMYYTLQGEGFHAGRAAVFCRFTGCNLWSGLEKDRSSAICTFCDTDFWGTDGENGGKYTLNELCQKIASLHEGSKSRFVVFTGGEPALQLDRQLIDELHALDFEIAIETNGTKPLPHGIDWVCVSPKADTEIVVTQGDELKLVYPQEENHPDAFAEFKFIYKYIQPKQDQNWDTNTALAIDFVKKNDDWRLSTQVHKYLNIP